MKYYTIITDKIPIGFFQDKIARDNAFDLYILSVKRFGIKGEAEL